MAEEEYKSKLDIKALEQIFDDVKELVLSARGQRDSLESSIEVLKTAIADEKWERVTVVGASLFRDLADLAKASEAFTSQERQALDLAAKILIEMQRIALEKERINKKSKDDMDFTKFIEWSSYQLEEQKKKTEKGTIPQSSAADSQE